MGLKATLMIFGFSIQRRSYYLYIHKLLRDITEKNYKTLESEKEKRYSCVSSLTVYSGSLRPRIATNTIINRNQMKS